MINNGSTVSNAGGTISTDSTSKLVLYAATINGGNLTAASPAVIDAQYIDYLGNVTITSGTTYFVDNSDTYLTGDLTNDGTVLIGSASSASALYIIPSTVNLSGSGTVILSNTGSDLSGPSGSSTLVNESNTIQGFGTVTGNLVNEGTVEPGDGPGILTVTGNYTQTSSGTLDIQIGGLNPANPLPGFSQLITGTSTLAGTLDVSLINGFTPSSQNEFVIVTSTDGIPVSGTFVDNTIQLGNVTFTVVYNPSDHPNDVVLKVLFSPVINTTQQPASATVGSSIADTATVSGGDNPTGTVTFNLYSNSTASGTPLFTDTETLGTGGVATSASYTATAAGTDYWVATYNGDSNNASVTSGTAAEPVTITTASPTIATSPSSLNLGTTTQGTAGTSQSFTVSGSNLTADIVLTAPTDVELSDNGGTSYSSTLDLAESGGTVSTTTVLARITATAPLGSVSGTIAADSTGATEQDITVSGTVNPVLTPTITVSTSSLNLGTTTQGTAGTPRASPSAAAT